MDALPEHDGVAAVVPYLWSVHIRETEGVMMRKTLKSRRIVGFAAIGTLAFAGTVGVSALVDAASADTAEGDDSVAEVDGNGAQDQSGDEPEEDSADAGASGQGGGLTFADSPLYQAFQGTTDFTINGYPNPLPIDDPAVSLDATLLEVETCMSDAGFEYSAQAELEAWEAEPVADPDAVALDLDEMTREQVLAEGYGIVTEYEEYESWLWLTDFVFAESNIDYFEGLSVDEQFAYENAFLGLGSAEVPPGGCWQNALDGAELPSGGVSWLEIVENPEFEDFAVAYEELIENTGTDERLVQLEQQWSGCMADAGYPGLSERWDATTRIDDSLMSIEEDGMGVGPDYEFVPSENQEALNSLAEKEIAMATADWDCANELDYRQRVLQVEYEWEQEFVDQWQEDIDALMSLYGQA
ncbi:MAG: hypothetical protein ACK5KU_08065 [Beutenbergiaceae bacterium]